MIDKDGHQLIGVLCEIEGCSSVISGCGISYTNTLAGPEFVACPQLIVRRRDISITIFNNVLPVNARPFIQTIIDEMDESGTNNLLELKDNLKVQNSMWFLMQQLFDTLDDIDMMTWWEDLMSKYDSNK